MLLRCLAAFIAIGLVCLGGWFGRKVPFAEQWPMFEALRTTASIIFAVIGAWMAIIYPERLKLSLRDPASALRGGSTGLGKLFTPVVNSTAILCVILVLGAIVPILRKYAPPMEIEACRGISYGLLVALTIWQLWTVVLSLVPASIVKAYVDREDRVNRVHSDLFSLTSKERDSNR